MEILIHHFPTTQPSKKEDLIESPLFEIIRNNVGNWIHNNELIKYHILNHFVNIYQTDVIFVNRHPHLNNHHFPISNKEHSTLSLPVGPQ